MPTTSGDLGVVLRLLQRGRDELGASEQRRIVAAQGKCSPFLDCHRNASTWRERMAAKLREW